MLKRCSNLVLAFSIALANVSCSDGTENKVKKKDDAVEYQPFQNAVKPSQISPLARAGLSQEDAAIFKNATECAYAMTDTLEIAEKDDLGAAVLRSEQGRKIYDAQNFYIKLSTLFINQNPSYKDARQQIYQQNLANYTGELNSLSPENRVNVIADRFDLCDLEYKVLLKLNR